MSKLINFHPILFQPEMVKANLDGRKTETRRVIKPPFSLWITDDNINSEWANALTSQCPYGQPGDILWVRENYAPPVATQKDNSFMYAADYPVNPFAKGLWKPSIHMPKEACRMFLLLKEVKVERLQDITDESAIGEGYHNNQDVQSPYLWYRNLWVTINGLENWLQNPWVWVLKYEVLSTTGIEPLYKALVDRNIDGTVVAQSLHNFLKQDKK